MVSNMLTKPQKEQLISEMKHERCNFPLEQRIILRKIIDNLPEKEEQFLPTIRTCEGCRHQGCCIKSHKCSRGLSRKDFYQSR